MSAFIRCPTFGRGSSARRVNEDPFPREISQLANGTASSATVEIELFQLIDIFFFFLSNPKLSTCKFRDTGTQIYGVTWLNSGSR